MTQLMTSSTTASQTGQVNSSRSIPIKIIIHCKLQECLSFEGNLPMLACVISPTRHLEFIDLSHHSMIILYANFAFLRFSILLFL